MESTEHDRIHERISGLEHRFNASELNVAIQLTNMNAKLTQILELASSYVTKERFQIVQLLVYGFTAIILTGVMGAIIAKVIVK